MPIRPKKIQILPNLLRTCRDHQPAGDSIEWAPEYSDAENMSQLDTSRLPETLDPPFRRRDRRDLQKNTFPTVILARLG